MTESLCYWLKKPFMAGTDCVGAIAGSVVFLILLSVSVGIMIMYYSLLFGKKDNK